MMNNRKIFFLSAVLLVAAVSCRKAYQELPLQEVVIYTKFPSKFTKTEAGHTSLTLTNTNTGEVITAESDANGRAVIPRVLSGNYDVQATRHVTDDEAEELTGTPEGFNMNGSMLNLLAAAGAPNYDITLFGSYPKPLLFKELYYTGSRTPLNGTYFSDQFYEIYNNTPEVVYADGLCIGNTGGSPGNSTTARPWGFKDDANYVYLQNVWMVPGDPLNPKYPIQPGESIIIAQDGIDHKTDPLGNPNSPVNLGGAEWETYVPRADNRDLDADVPNLEAIYLGSVGFDWLTSIFGPGMVIFRHAGVKELPHFTEPGATSSSLYMQVPVDSVFDAVDLLANPTAGNYKRIPVGLDAGFISCSGTYVGEGVRRKVARMIGGRKVLQDFNNTTVDFEVVKPPVVKW